jgi:general secretion pathway protein M
MTLSGTIERVLAHSPTVAGAIYATLLGVLAALTCFALAEIYGSEQGLAEASDLLQRLTGRKVADTGGGDAMTGSPFIEGRTVTVAGAALLQRVAAATAKVGGTIQSSQVDILGSQGGTVNLVVSCELSQPALQRLLYDLEAGMPFLFVDQLTVQVPQAVEANAGNGRMRVTLAISGQWQGGIK